MVTVPGTPSLGVEVDGGPAHGPGVAGHQGVGARLVGVNLEANSSLFDWSHYAQITEFCTSTCFAPVRNANLGWGRRWLEDQEGPGGPGGGGLGEGDE